MSDCYGEPCKVCGLIVPMHLKDFNTSRREIVAVCGKCIGTMRDFGMLGLSPYPYTEHSFHDEGKPWRSVRIYALTANAWNHREGNHPNVLERGKLGEHSAWNGVNDGMD